jgi:hypothetical protein
MQTLHDWITNCKSSDDNEAVAIARAILSALEVHVVENYDGYGNGRQPDAMPMTELQAKALESARRRRAEELKAMAEFAKTLKQAKRMRRKTIVDPASM